MTAISDQTRQYWFDIVLGWAYSRLPAPQFDECKAALTPDADVIAALTKRATAAEQEAQALAVVAKDQVKFDLVIARGTCAFCGWEYGPSVLMDANAVGAHVAACPKHPMRAVEAARDEALLEITAQAKALGAMLDAERQQSQKLRQQTFKEAIQTCRDREQLHDRNTAKYIAGAPEYYAHSCYSTEANEIANALAKLAAQPPKSVMA